MGGECPVRTTCGVLCRNPPLGKHPSASGSAKHLYQSVSTSESRDERTGVFAANLEDMQLESGAFQHWLSPVRGEKPSQVRRRQVKVRRGGPRRGKVSGQGYQPKLN